MASTTRENLILRLSKDEAAAGVRHTL